MPARTAAAPAGVSRRWESLSAALRAIAPTDVDAVIEGARRQRVKKAAVLASIASSTFERGWVNVQRDPDDEQLMSALPPATWRTT
ncbi:hypothetical protein [Paraburkholderia sp. 40]|uniref:hypothetical protein n=1 Tax=Paraburkholderia sp. 40 TaxID=2991059 RepID=UPI003D260CCC